MKGEKKPRRVVRHTHVVLKPEVWLALRRMADARSLEVGGQSSASAVLGELVEREVARLARPDA